MVLPHQKSDRFLEIRDVIFLNSINQLQIKIDYIGFVIIWDNIVTNASRVQAIGKKKKSTVETIKPLEKFLGIFWYTAKLFSSLVQATKMSCFNLSRKEFQNFKTFFSSTRRTLLGYLGPSIEN